MKKALIIAALAVAAVTAYAQPLSEEKFSRGFAGVCTNNGVHLSWRMLPSDRGNMTFDIYRQTGGSKAEKINAKGIRTTSDYFDTDADLDKDNRWILKAEGKELAIFERPASSEKLQYIRIPLDKPEARQVFRVTARFFGSSDDYNSGDESDTYNYKAGDCSIGDLDGDGEMEIVLKWNPTNSTTPERTGVTGNTLLDAYKLDGTRLWRIDLGHNVRSTALGVPFIVYDLDGDGKAEIVCRTADGSIDGAGVVIGNPRADWRSMDEASETFGRTVIGPEYITVFSGIDGKAIDSRKYVPIRFPLDSWGGIGSSDEQGTAADRFTAGVAYLDGKTASAFFVRGGKGRTVIAAWKFDGKKLHPEWTFDSADKGWGTYSANGNPNVSVGDFDSDGADEICVGAMIVDNDGKGLLSTRLLGGDALHTGKFIPGRKGLQVFGIHDTGGAIGAFLENPAMAMYDAATGEIIWSKGPGETIGRGLAADIDPRHPGAEVWIGSKDPDPVMMRRPMPVWMKRPEPTLPKYEGPLKGVFNGETGELISSEAPSSCNFTLYWDADPQQELLDGTSIMKWNWETQATDTLYTATGVKAINATKATPCFSGDILGDWREEVIWVENDDSALRIYMTDVPAESRTTTLLSDRMYRLALVWQNVGYNQPPHTSYDMNYKLSTKK